MVQTKCCGGARLSGRALRKLPRQHGRQPVPPPAGAHVLAARRSPRKGAPRVRTPCPSLRVVAQSQGTAARAPAQTPHSGYHYLGTPGRFFEGWYFRVAIPNGPSFAFMYSIEDPQGGTTFAGVGAQVMGPDDGYLVQHQKNVNNFWASPTQLSLGNAFAMAPASAAYPKNRLLSPDRFADTVSQGFQVSTEFHQGSLIREETTVGAGPPSTVQTCQWKYTTRPVFGWGGNTSQQQRATAGWLAALPVFEPHWQVLMSKGLSTGWIEWDGERYEFEDAPSYSEKNWGGAFPLKWFWMQCNSFASEPQLALTVGGGRRELPFLPGTSENVALIGIHWKDEFIGLTPWTGSISWDIQPWGRWKTTGHNDKYVAEVVAHCEESDGTTLRAPTADGGLAGFCRDTFYGRLEIRIWKRTLGGRGELLLEASSTTAALEVGGGPWWQAWKETSQMTEPLRGLLAADLPIEDALEQLPQFLRPPGL